MKSISEINRFILVFAAIFLPFFILDSFVAEEWSPLARLWNVFYHIILKFVMTGSVGLLELFGYPVKHTYDIIWIEGAKQSLKIGHPCLALDLMVLFAALIIAYPGHKKSKYWVIPAGALFIQILNVIRMAMLTVAAKERLGNLEFEHHYIFKGVVYLFIFVIWMLWIRFFPVTDTTDKAKA